MLYLLFGYTGRLIETVCLECLVIHLIISSENFTVNIAIFETERIILTT